MSGKSKKSSPKPRPKTPATNGTTGRRQYLAQARELAEQYQVVLTNEEGHWYGRGLEMPHVFGDGATVEGCVKDTRQAMTQAVAYLLEQGQQAPTPAASGRRNEQVNVRLTADEKLLLEASAKRKGFSGLSDFIRAAAIEAAR